MEYVGIYFLIGLVLSVWSYKATLPSERWNTPIISLFFFWPVFILIGLKNWIVE